MDRTRHNMHTTLNNIEQHVTGHHLWPTSKISTKSIFLIVLTNQAMSHCAMPSSPPISNAFAHPPAHPCHLQSAPSCRKLCRHHRHHRQPQRPVTDRSGHPECPGPMQGSNASGLAVTALSCANEFDAGGALGGDGSIATSSIAHPPSTTITTFLQHQHAIPCAASTSLTAAATHPMSTTSAATTAHLTAVATTMHLTAMAVTTHSTAA